MAFKIVYIWNFQQGVELWSKGEGIGIYKDNEEKRI